MVAQIINMMRRPSPGPRDWAQAEIAEFYRVENALAQAGLRIETDRGVSDEGDPWFVFCRADDGEVVIHFARIDGRYVVSSPAYEGVAEGHDFPTLVRGLLARHPLVQTRRAANGNVFMHPAALLIAIVGTAFFKTSEAKADDGSARGEGRRMMLATTSQPGAVPLTTNEMTLKVDGPHAMAILTSAVLILQREGGMSTPVLMGQNDILPTKAATTDALSYDVFERASERLHLNAAGVEAVELKALLALAAVLADLPASAQSLEVAPLQAAVASLPQQAAVKDVDTDIAQHLPAAPPAEQWRIEIDLRAAAVPEVSALRIVQIVAQGAGAELIVHQGRLPDILAKIIAQGTVLDAAQPFAPAVDVKVAPESGEAIAPGPVPDSPQQPETSKPIVGSGGDLVQKQIFDFFMTHTSKVEIAVTTAKLVVIYDASLFLQNADWSDVRSVTLTYDDGSSVSLVGHAPSLADYHLAT